MSRLKWYYNRLRAMNPAEIAWRIGQKFVERRERGLYGRGDKAVDSEIFDERLRVALGDGAGSLLSAGSFPRPYFEPCTVDEAISLLGGYDYAAFRRRWHAGFQTDAEWPHTFSYDIVYKQRDDIGDARTNWELNRHYQLARLAEHYAATADDDALDALESLLADWSAANPFLIGISWTSPMEVAIRAIQWLLASYFLAYRPSERVARMRRRLETGAINMVDYVTVHRSRYSSANNHLLVEAAAIAIAGHTLGHSPWLELGVALLDEQLPLQNSPDGVNLEMALHYQSFAMEAYALVGLVIGADNLPASWREPLARQAAFVRSSLASGHPLEFGDNDEGKIVYPRDTDSHYAQVLEWLREAYGIADEQPRRNVTYPGGYTFLSDVAGRVHIAIDHAPLGFGSIAAHGHADALSFQAVVGGEPLFVDPGTYIYHCMLGERDYFRRTIVHNTVTVNGADQSRMLGAFLWGDKAVTTVAESRADDTSARLDASHDGYRDIKHRRVYDWDGRSARLDIADSLSAPADRWDATFMLAPDCDAMAADGRVDILRRGDKVAEIKYEGDATVSVDDEWYSSRYGRKEPVKAVRFHGSGDGRMAYYIQFLDRKQNSKC